MVRGSRGQRAVERRSAPWRARWVACALVPLLWTSCGDDASNPAADSAVQDVGVQDVGVQDANPLADAVGADGALGDSGGSHTDALDGTQADSDEADGAADGLGTADGRGAADDAPLTDLDQPDELSWPDVEPDEWEPLDAADGWDAADGSDAADASETDSGLVCDAEPDGAEPDAGEIDPSQWAGIRCGDTPPAGAVLAAEPKPYTGGECPELVFDGVTKNTIVSNGVAREFLLIAPADIQPGEQLPVVFAWHWLKGKAKTFVEQGELIDAVAEQRFIAIIPESLGDLSIEIPFVADPFEFPWPFSALDPASRFEQEHVFFDDMLACTAAQFPIDKECVSVAGVSAGALYGIHLASARSEHISSFISLSGGIRTDQPLVNSILRDWTPPSSPMPMLVLWGGATDSCALLSFQAASTALEGALDSLGSFVVECVHNCGHGVPPIEPPDGISKFAFLWEFAWSHPYWLPEGASPWAAELPDVTPEWCAIGSGNAVIREGSCDEPGCPL